MNKPNAFSVPDFDSLMASFTVAAVDYVALKNVEKSALLATALQNKSELLTQVMESNMIQFQAMLREQNYWALQMFRKYVSETEMVDLLASQYQLTRQVIIPADTSVFPPVTAVMESNDDLLRRFDLAPYQFHCTGTRMGYKFHALTLDEKPFITVDGDEKGVTMRFEFPSEVQPALVKDASARMLEAYTGKVQVAILSRETESGIASEGLLNRVETYLNRDDIGQETDEVKAVSAVPVTYQYRAICYTDGDPSKDITKAAAKQTVSDFVSLSHKLNGRVDRLEAGHVLYALGFGRVELLSPVADIICAWNEAPYCTEIIIDVKAQ